MAADSFGPKNEPQFGGDGVPQDAADLTTVAAFASKVGNRRIGTTTDRTTAIGTKDMWPGLEWYDITDGNWYQANANASAWVVISGRWTDFSATYSGMSGGTINYAKMRRVADTLRVEFMWTMGSSGAISNPVLGLPIQPAAWWSGTRKLGNVNLIDANGNRYDGTAVPSPGGGVFSARALYFSGGPPSFQLGITGTTPFTWASGDQIGFSLDYPIDVS